MDKLPIGKGLTLGGATTRAKKEGELTLYEMWFYTATIRATGQVLYIAEKDNVPVKAFLALTITSVLSPTGVPMKMAVGRLTFKDGANTLFEGDVEAKRVMAPVFSGGYTRDDNFEQGSLVFGGSTRLDVIL